MYTSFVGCGFHFVIFLGFVMFFLPVPLRSQGKVPLVIGL